MSLEDALSGWTGPSSDGEKREAGTNRADDCPYGGEDTLRQRLEDLKTQEPDGVDALGVGGQVPRGMEAGRLIVAGPRSSAVQEVDQLRNLAAALVRVLSVGPTHRSPPATQVDSARQGRRSVRSKSARREPTFVNVAIGATRSSPVPGRKCGPRRELPSRYARRKAGVVRPR